MCDIIFRLNKLYTKCFLSDLKNKRNILICIHCAPNLTRNGNDQ